jgi:hypothetical protein
MTPTEEQRLLDALAVAEETGDIAVIECAVNGLALYYLATDNVLAAVPFWRRGADLIEMSTAPDSRELATYLHNMAALCLIPAGLREEAEAMLQKSKQLYNLHFQADARCMRDVDELLNEIKDQR